MKHAFLLAVRNLQRNRRRSVATLLAMIVGVCAILLFGGFSRDITLGMRSDIGRGSGHLQIQRRGYYLLGSGNSRAYGVRDYARIIQALQDDPVLRPMVSVITPTLEAGGVAGNFDAGVTRTVMLQGVVPADQTRLQRWNDYGFAYVPVPSLLQGTEEDAAVTGFGLARVLQLCGPLHLKGCANEGFIADHPTDASAANAPADVVALAAAEASAKPATAQARIDVLAATTSGAPNVGSFHVVDVDRQGVKEFDDVYVAVHLPRAQRLVYGRDEPAVTAIVVQLHHTSQLEAARAGLIDTASCAKTIAAPASASFVLRADLAVLTARRERFATVLKQVVAQAASGGGVGADALSVSLDDLVSQKLAMPDADIPLVVHFGSEGNTYDVQIEESVALRADATYLITGGLGGFGQKTAEWLVDHGARHLVLAGRSGADTPERRAFVDALAARGVEVVCVKCDLANADAVRALFEQLAARPQPLRGVFHAAAVIIDEPVGEISGANLEAVMLAKAGSARLLHEHTRELELDYFVLYSSIANLVGNSRQASYVAANGFLDGLAWHRRALGLAATSINWGAIEDVGVIARDAKLEQFMRYTGLRGMQTREALHWLERALRRDFVQLGIGLITNWAEWGRFETLGSQSKRFASLIEGDSGTDAGARDRLRVELESIEPGERFGVLAGLVSAQIADELEMPVENIVVDRPILDYGVDSLMATEIQLLLDKDLGIAVSVLEILDGLTVRAIVERTLGRFGWGEAGAYAVEQKAA